MCAVLNYTVARDPAPLLAPSFQWPSVMAESQTAGVWDSQMWTAGTVLYCNVMYSTVLYSTLLYCTLLKFRGNEFCCFDGCTNVCQGAGILMIY